MTQPHNAQAFYSFIYPGATSVAPTDDELKTNVQPQCKDAAKTKVDESKLPQNAHDQHAVSRTTARGRRATTTSSACIENDTDFSGLDHEELTRLSTSSVAQLNEGGRAGVPDRGQWMP